MLVHISEGPCEFTSGHFAVCGWRFLLILQSVTEPLVTDVSICELVSVMCLPVCVDVCTSMSAVSSICLLRLL